MNREETIKFIQEKTMESAEVVKYLDLSKARLSAMKAAGKLEPILTGYYLREDVEERKKEQAELRDKFYRPAKKVEE